MEEEEWEGDEGEADVKGVIEVQNNVRYVQQAYRRGDRRDRLSATRPFCWERRRGGMTFDGVDSVALVGSNGIDTIL